VLSFSLEKDNADCMILYK